MAKNQVKQLFGVVPNKITEAEVLSKTSKFKGLNYPLGSRASEGGFFASNSGKQAVRQAVSQLLRTERGERVMNPRFGCNLRRFLFQPLTEDVFNQIKLEVASAFNRYIVGASIVKLAVFSLNETGPSGGNALKIILNYELNENESAVDEVEVVLS